MQPVAIVSSVLPESPADYAGFSAGCKLFSVNGHVLHDIIDWRWYSAEDYISIFYEDAEGDCGTVTLERSEGQDWGFEFQDALFDGTYQCKNACTFCFMQQLPEDARDSLSMRDDDFRLSFLQGTFVTFTNLTESDVARIIEQHISPLRYSLHAVTPALRKSIIGKHAGHGFNVAQQLLDAGIEMHAQIVLMPGVNDGQELEKTLGWAYEQKNIKSVGIVPVGYTKHQSTFSESFNKPQLARNVINLIAPFQKRALATRGSAWVHASDEFYRNAYPDNLLEMLPPTHYYGSFDLFEDGIGIVRSFVDDFLQSDGLQHETAEALTKAECTVIFVCGCAQREFFTPLLEQSPLHNLIVPLYVENNYFGGNVDVTGLLCACDIIPAIKEAVAATEVHTLVVIPSVVFNADGVTLDDATLGEIRTKSGSNVHMVSCSASEFLSEITRIVREGGDKL